MHSPAVLVTSRSPKSTARLRSFTRN
uniref:HCLS1 binding protein 3 n=5 Tax=Cercopithecidae TaxID=9527 RepID=A0A2K5N2D0_CERAT